ncbi:hypothetical protein JCM1393_05590 [Clostridium carnis]
MRKLLKKFDIGYERYNELNMIIIILSGMIIFLPIIIYLIRLIFPNIWRCPYYELTHNPCPFCGITTDIRNILKGNIFEYKYNLISIPIIFLSIMEIFIRIKLICGKNKLKSIKYRREIFKFDFIYHGIIIISIFIYVLAFFIFDLRRF